MKLKEAVYIELNRQIVRINQRHNPQRTFPLILLLVIPNLIGTHCISFLIDVVCDTRCFQKTGNLEDNLETFNRTFRKYKKSFN